jgi:uncharacterized membrane protein YsdA (DUF1294 family)
MGRPAGRRRPVRFHLFLALILCLVGTVGLWWGLGTRGDWAHWLACWLIVINVVTFGYYGYDKGRANSANSRVPEVVLHGLAAAGGSVAAYAAMRVFRHKTIKGRFRILFWCIVVLQVALLLWIIKAWW